MASAPSAAHDLVSASTAAKTLSRRASSCAYWYLPAARFMRAFEDCVDELLAAGACCDFSFLQMATYVSWYQRKSILQRSVKGDGLELAPNVSSTRVVPLA